MAEALTDAAVVYGAQRYFDGVHALPQWPYATKYSVQSDQLLFFEFLHNIMLYDKLYLDNSSLEEAVAIDLVNFIKKVNYELGFEWIVVENIGRPARVDADSSAYYFCSLLHTILTHDASAEARISLVPIPWAYEDGRHKEHKHFSSKFAQLGLPAKFLPFAIYCWRALTYDAMAISRYKQNNERFAYVAAPGRLIALKSILNRTDIKRYSLPRELLREIRSWAIPQFPSGGFDFSYLHTIPFYATSPVSNSVFNLSPTEALAQVCSARRSLEAREIRDDWNDILFESSNYAAVGGIYIQILKNVTSSGSVSQNQIIRATPSDLDDIFVEA